jgi:MATE family multidrug resistance protein
MAARLLLTAFPLAGVYLADLAVEATDTAMVGRLGATEVAAVGLGATIIFLYTVFFMSVPSTADVFVAERNGQGDRVGAIEAAQHGLWLSVAMVVPAMVLVWWLEPLLRAAGQAQEIAVLARDYAVAVSPAFVAWAAFSTLDFFVAALNRPGIAFAIAWVGVGLNAIGNYGLIYGNFGFPRLGVVGAAYATDFAAFANLLLIVITVSVHPAIRPYRVLTEIRPLSAKLFRELLRLGLPSGIGGVLEVAYITVSALLIGRYSADLLAASQISLSFNLFLYAFVSGLALGLTYLVAELNGHGRVREIWTANLAGQSIAFVFLGLVAVLCLTAPRLIVGLFLSLEDPANQASIAYATTIIGIVALARILHGVRWLSYRALKGMRDTLVPSMSSIACSWGIGLPLGLWLAYRTSLGGIGFMLGDLAAAAAGAVVLSLRLRHMTHRRVNP